MAHFPVAFATDGNGNDLGGALGLDPEYQSAQFDLSWDQFELDPELADLFPGVVAADSASNANNDHDYAARTASHRMDGVLSGNPVFSDAAVVDSTTSGGSDLLLTPDPSPAADSGALGSLGLDLPGFDFNLYPLATTVEEGSVKEEDVIVYSDREDENEDTNEAAAAATEQPMEEDKINDDKENDEDDVQDTPDGNVKIATRDVIVIPAPKSSNAAGSRSAARRRRRKPKANAWSTEIRPKVAAKLSARPRLYEQRPFDDPELERCRQNALQAKQNRDRKRQERLDMERELKDLRSENARLRRRELSMSKRMSGLESQLRRVEELLRTRSLEGLLEVVKCDRDHPTARARAACRACSLGNKA